MPVVPQCAEFVGRRIRGGGQHTTRTAMRTLHWNGERWYVNEMSLLKRVRRWFIWIGGWELANGRGWRLRTPREQGRQIWMHPTPVSVLGHRATFYGHWF